MNKKTSKLFLLISLFALLIVVAAYLLGCGQGAILSEKEHATHPFYIVSVSPELGTAEIPPAGEITITFSNRLQTTEVLSNISNIDLGPANTAGVPTITGDIIWSNDDKTATVTIEGWSTPEGHVQIITTGVITDEYGHTLPGGITLWDYGLIGSPLTYTISGKATGGTAGKTVYVCAATTSEPSSPSDTLGFAVGTANPFYYTIYGLSTGEYYILAIRDNDGSGDPTPGDYIGAFPDLTNPTSIEVPPSTTEVNFILNSTIL